jgi:hypothetical protein
MAFNREGNSSGAADQPPAKLVAQGFALVKMENDSQQMMALQNPRDEKKVFDGAIQELRLNPEHAARSYYSIPHKDRSGGQEKTVFVEGPGIKAAMSLSRRWGNCANSGRIVDDQNDFLVVQGVFLDYETNFRTLRDVTVQKKARKKDGTYYTLPVDRLQMAIQAGISKAVRNAILASLPVGVIDAYFREAKKLAIAGPTAGGAKAKPIAERLRDARAKFKKRGVDDRVMDLYIRNRIADNDGEWKDEDVLLHLIGVWNALEDNQTTIEDVFRSESIEVHDADRPQEKASGASTDSDLFKK